MTVGYIPAGFGNATSHLLRLPTDRPAKPWRAWWSWSPSTPHLPAGRHPEGCLPVPARWAAAARRAGCSAFRLSWIAVPLSAGPCHQHGRRQPEPDGYPAGYCPGIPSGTRLQLVNSHLIFERVFD
ncbi:MAG: hypothetical protein ACLGIS_15630 [Actinomycetes bacterium]